MNMVGTLWVPCCQTRECWWKVCWNSETWRGTFFRQSFWFFVCLFQLHFISLHDVWINRSARKHTDGAYFHLKVHSKQKISVFWLIFLMLCFTLLNSSRLPLSLLNNSCYQSRGSDRYMKTQALRRRRLNLALLRTQTRCVWVAVCVFVWWEGGLQLGSGQWLFHGQLTGAGIKTLCRNLFLVYSLRSAVALWGANIGEFPSPGRENKKRGGKHLTRHSSERELKVLRVSLSVFFPCPVTSTTVPPDCGVSGRGLNKLKSLKTTTAATNGVIEQISLQKFCYILKQIVLCQLISRIHPKKGGI